MGRFYIVIIQAVLLYSANSLAITNRNMKRLRSFHNRAVKYLTGRHIYKREDDWEYPNHNELYNEAKLLLESTLEDEEVLFEST